MALTDGENGMNTTMLVSPTGGYGQSNGFGGFGGDGWWIILLFLLAGNGVWGGFGGGFGGYGNMADGGGSYAYDGGSYARRGGNRGGGSSYARGRTGNVRRDSMGRYSREDISEMRDQLREMMDKINNMQ